MTVKFEPVNLELCGLTACNCCWVDMRVCADCGCGPLNDSQDSCENECGHCPHNKKKAAMKWFGEALGPYAVPEEQVFMDYVIGRECVDCGNDIDWNDSGVVLPYIPKEGELKEVVTHHECLVSNILPDPPEAFDFDKEELKKTVKELQEQYAVNTDTVVQPAVEEDIAFEDIQDDPFTSKWYVLKDDVYDDFVIGTADKPLEDYEEEGPEICVCHVEQENLAHYIADMHNDRLEAGQDD